MTEGEERLIVGRYRLRRSLGRGGMGVVWLASDEVLDRDVAIKEIQPHGRTLLDTDPEVARALREARAAAKLSDHPGIVTVHDVVTDDHGLPWIVMQLLKGHSLSAVLEAGGPVPVERAASIGAQVLQALDYAHSANVLHRDVKPGNVMLTDDKAVLTDFGIAVIDGDSVLTATGQLAGAPEYIAPERILGREAVPATDRWSVGIMLYGMVVGRTPFRRADKQATLSAALTREPDPDPRVGRLGPVVKGLLRKQPEERMTAQEAISRLTAIAGTTSPHAATYAVRPEDPTEDPDAAVTASDNTVPPFPQHGRTGPHLRPDAPTLAPVRRSWQVPVFTALIVLAAVVLAVVYLVNLPQGQEAAAPPTTTTPLPDLARYEERLGFEISIPPRWQRSESTADQDEEDRVSTVSWKDVPVDPTVGAMEVTVRRDTGEDVGSAAGYLADHERNIIAGQEFTGYKNIASVPDRGGSARLEYTCRADSGPTRLHVRVFAVAADDLFTVTFLLWANDSATLADRWAAAEPVVETIWKSFRVT